jgi:uncharacterized membrane protein
MAETDEWSWWLLLPSQLRDLPADLAVTVGWVLLTTLAVFLPAVEESGLRVVLGLPYVLFVPGYAFIAALFPEAGEGVIGEAADTDDSDNERDSQQRSGIDGIERVALSFGLSIAIVPLLGLVLNFTPWGIRLVPIVVSVSGFTIVMSTVAARRRLAVPEAERFAVPYRAWAGAAKAELLNPETRGDAVVNVLLAVSVVLAVSSIGYAVAVPKQGEAFTELYLLTETDDGELVADGYPTEFERGTGKPIVVGIGNQEHRPVNYTLVVELQRVSVQNNSTRVIAERELRRFDLRVEHNETWHRRHVVTPTMTGERLRLAYLLYTESVQAEPTLDNSYREVHLWVNVTHPESTASGSSPQTRHAAATAATTAITTASPKPAAKTHGTTETTPSNPTTRETTALIP